MSEPSFRDGCIWIVLALAPIVVGLKVLMAGPNGTQLLALGGGTVCYLFALGEARKLASGDRKRSATKFAAGSMLLLVLVVGIGAVLLLMSYSHGQ
jgi:hypothetical protein